MKNQQTIFVDFNTKEVCLRNPVQGARSNPLLRGTQFEFHWGRGMACRMGFDMKHYTNYDCPAAIHMGANVPYMKLSNLHNTQGRVERWKLVPVRRERRKTVQHTTSLRRFKPSAGCSKWSRRYVIVAKQGCVMHYKLANWETRTYNYSFVSVTVC